MGITPREAVTWRWYFRPLITSMQARLLTKEPRTEYGIPTIRTSHLYFTAGEFHMAEAVTKQPSTTLHPPSATFWRYKCQTAALANRFHSRNDETVWLVPNHKKSTARPLAYHGFQHMNGEGILFCADTIEFAEQLTTILEQDMRHPNSLTLGCKVIQIGLQSQWHWTLKSWRLEPQSKRKKIGKCKDMV